MAITTSLLSLLDLEEIEKDLFRSRDVSPEPHHLYGGQVAAQSLWAAAQTVPGLEPHSLHGYFLRAGDPTKQIVFRVDRDRDGRSYTARRVVAIQNGEVLFNLACSFHAAETGRDEQVQAAPDAGDPETMPPLPLPLLVGIECRLPEQPFHVTRAPTRIWARSSEALPDDPTVHAP